MTVNPYMPRTEPANDRPGYPTPTLEQRDRALDSARRLARPSSPVDIVRAWKDEGQIIRVPTGIRTLDEACRGGLPIPWRLSIVGAPSAGKTALAYSLAHRLELAGLCVGILGVDEEPEDGNARFVQMAGFTIAQCEQRDAVVLEAIIEKLSTLRVRFYDSTHTIESAQDDLGSWAASEGRKAAFVVDTVQTARSEASADARGPRELVERNVAALRAGVTKHKFLLIALSEANRGSYRTEDAADTSNDMAAGAESRAIEFMAQTLMMLRTPKGHADVVHARVPKNRKGARSGFEFFLRLDRDRHALTECPDPSGDPSAGARRDEEKRSTNVRALECESLEVLRVIVDHPGLGERALRAELRRVGHRIGVDGLDAIKAHLIATGRVENRQTIAGKRTDAHYFAIAPAVQNEGPYR